MSTARARRYSPIFDATITPESVEPLTTTQGKDYTRLSATISRQGKPDMKRVVMAFGKSNEAVRGLLIPGQPVELAIQLDGGSAKIIGLPRPKLTIANDAPSLETVIVDLVAVLTHLDVDASLHEEILHAMLTGESEGPSDEGTDDEEVMTMFETRGHILFPLLDAGVDYGTAVRALNIILQLPAGQFLNDLRTLREQEGVRELVANA
jgi:hypothetical protein